MEEFVYNPPYYLTGEIGKSYGAAKREIGVIGAGDANLEFASQSEDTLSWTQKGGTPPEYAQIVTLFDKDGTRVFTGNVSSVVPTWTGSGLTTWDVVVSGPWWWLEKAQLTGLVAAASGEEAERVSFVLPTQDTAVSIASIITRMQSLGVPLAVGEIDPTFTVPQMILQGTSAAVALRDVLGLLPDCTTSVSYAGDGFPKLNVHRRGTMRSRTFTIGAEGNTLMAPVTLKPRLDLRPVSVEVQSMNLDSAGEIFYETQTAGDISGISGVLGRQLIAVSGPGRSDFRERTIRKTTVRTVPKASIQDAFYAKHQPLSELKRAAGGIELYALMTSSATITIPTGSGYTVTTYPAKTAYNIDGTATLSATNVYANLVVTEDLPDWWPETGIPRQRVKITARFVCGLVSGDPIYPEVAAIATFTHDVTGGTFFFADVDIEVDAGPYPATTPTLVIHPLDRALVQPVSGLAANLFQTQNWVPYDGTLPLAPGGTVPVPSRSINIRGGLPEWSNMRALMSGARINLKTGAASLRLGAPARQQAAQLVDRFQRSTRSSVIGL